MADQGKRHSQCFTRSINNIRRKPLIWNTSHSQYFSWALIQTSEKIDLGLRLTWKLIDWGERKTEWEIIYYICWLGVRCQKYIFECLFYYEIPLETFLKLQNVFEKCFWPFLVFLKRKTSWKHGNGISKSFLCINSELKISKDS